MKVENKLKTIQKASWFAEKLNLPLLGPDLDIIRVSPLEELEDNSLSFANHQTMDTDRQALIIGPKQLAGGSVSVLASANPRLDFAYALQLIDAQIGYAQEDEPPQIHPSVKIGQHVVIGRNVKIGEGTVIHHHVVIGNNVKIGKYCQINSGAIIGEGDFGFERDAAGRPVKIPHIGSVWIGDHVQIGSLSSVSRGTIGATRIGHYSKIDNHAYVAHNCQIGENVIVIGGSVLGGSSQYGSGTWVGINASIMQKTKVGENAMLGMGVVVLKDVEANAKMVGNPARRIP